MPEFRQNLATKEWVVVATERAVKPQSLRRLETQPALPEKDASCPFCPGNEAGTKPLSSCAYETQCRFLFEF